MMPTANTDTMVTEKLDAVQGFVSLCAPLCGVTGSKDREKRHSVEP